MEEGERLQRYLDAGGSFRAWPKMPDPVLEWADKGPHTYDDSGRIFHRGTLIATFHGNAGLAARAAGWLNRDVAEISAWIAEQHRLDDEEIANRSSS